MARYFECPIQCFSAAFDVLIKISESYRPQIPSLPSPCSQVSSLTEGSSVQTSPDLQAEIYSLSTRNHERKKSQEVVKKRERERESSASVSGRWSTARLTPEVTPANARSPAEGRPVDPPFPPHYRSWGGDVNWEDANLPTKDETANGGQGRNRDDPSPPALRRLPSD